MASDPILNPWQAPANVPEAAESPSDDVEFVSAPPKRPPWGPWASLGWTLVCFIAFLLAQTAVMVVVIVIKIAGGAKVDPSELATNGNLIALATLASTPVVVGLVLLLIWVRRVPIREYLAWVWPRAGEALIAIGVLGVVLLVSDLTTHFTGHPIVPPFMLSVYKTGWLPLLLLALVVAAPVGEEVLVRGFLFHGIAESRWGRIPAILITSLLWAGVHVQYDAFAIATVFVMGLYLGAIRSRFGSVPLTILLHAIANAVATIEVIVKVEWLS